MWRCVYLPWHKMRVSKRYKYRAGYQVKCSCGKLYTMHDGVKTIVPWNNEFEHLYMNEEILS